jgi:hypothetical protein
VAAHIRAAAVQQERQSGWRQGIRVQQAQRRILRRQTQAAGRKPVSSKP